jgi:hypothetical protein
MTQKQTRYPELTARLLGDNYICAPCCLRKECYQGTRLRPAQL